MRRLKGRGNCTGELSGLVHYVRGVTCTQQCYFRVLILLPKTAKNWPGRLRSDNSAPPHNVFLYRQYNQFNYLSFFCYLFPATLQQYVYHCNFARNGCNCHHETFSRHRKWNGTRIDSVIMTRVDISPEIIPVEKMWKLSLTRTPGQAYWILSAQAWKQTLPPSGLILYYSLRKRVFNLSCEWTLWDWASVYFQERFGQTIILGYG